MKAVFSFISILKKNKERDPDPAMFSHKLWKDYRNFIALVASKYAPSLIFDYYLTEFST